MQLFITLMLASVDNRNEAASMEAVGDIGGDRWAMEQ